MLSPVAVRADPLVFLPFRFGVDTYCTQGQGGSFSHQGNQYYGFDFNQGSNYNGRSNSAFGLPVHSPVDGEVVEIRDGVYDFQNNSSSNYANNWGWGNTIVIKDERGVYYLRFAHLRFGSTDHLRIGDRVKQYDYIGEIGQTGFSTSPHLHFQIMRSRTGPSVNFTFVEGELNSYEWIKSNLFRRISVLDNNNEKSLSHDFRYGYTYRYGYWQQMNWDDGAVGKNYMRHTIYSYNDPSYFKWRFRVKDSSMYAIYASIPPNPKNDKQAKYYYNGKYLKSIDQTKHSYFFRLIAFKYLSASKTHTIKVKGTSSNRYLVADSLILVKW